MFKQNLLNMIQKAKREKFMPYNNIFKPFGREHQSISVRSSRKNSQKYN